MSGLSSGGTAAVTVGAVLLGVAACGAALYLTGRGGVEHAKFSVVRRCAGAPGRLAFELRRYAPAVAAVTRVSAAGGGGGGGDAMRRATSRGFRPLATYIFGGNDGASSVAMTAPVVSEPLLPPGAPGAGRSIAMTAPVVSQPGEGAGSEAEVEVSFIMPSRYASARELPAPLSRGVELRELPERFEAVASLGGGASADGARTAAAARELLASLRAEGLRAAPAAPGAGALVDGARVVLRAYSYDPPWTPAFMRRNEVSIAVEAPA